jgi:hypothetical protein
LAELPWSSQLPLRASLGLPIEHGDYWPIRAGVFLIGPDGKIVAKDLHGDAIKAAVAKALAVNTPSASGKHSVMSPAIHIAPPRPPPLCQPQTSRAFRWSFAARPTS